MSQPVIKSSNATVQHGVARADGTLVLTQDSVQFTPFNQAFGLGPYTLMRSSISEVDNTRAKGAGILPLSSDAIKITLNSGQAYEFILANPAQWLDALKH